MENSVTVTGFGRLKQRLGTETTVAAGQTARQAVENLHLSENSGLPLTPVVNGRVVAWEYLLQPGDTLTLIPTIGGGR